MVMGVLDGTSETSALEWKWLRSHFEMKNAGAKGVIKTEIDKAKIIGKNAEKNWVRKENTALNLS